MEISASRPRLDAGADGSTPGGPTWSTGWLGITAAGMDTDGFGAMSLAPGKRAEVMFTVIHPHDGEMYEMLELRYTRARARVDMRIMFPGVGEAIGVADEFELYSSVLLPEGDRPVMRSLLAGEPQSYPELFTRMASYHSKEFRVLTRTYAIQNLPEREDDEDQPQRNDLWRPVEIGTPQEIFSIKDAVALPLVQNDSINYEYGYGPM